MGVKEGGFRRKPLATLLPSPSFAGQWASPSFSLSLVLCLGGVTSKYTAQGKEGRRESVVRDLLTKADSPLCNFGAEMNLLREKEAA